MYRLLCAPRIAVHDAALPGPHPAAEPLAAPETSPRSRWPASSARTALGVLALHASSTSGGPTLPETSGRLRRAPPVSGQPMGLAQADAMARQANRAMHALHPVAQAARGLADTPQTLDGMGSEAGFREAVEAMFGPTPANAAPAGQPLALVPPSAHAAAPFIAPLVLATALKSMGIASLADAEPLLQATAHGPPSPESFRLERMLAASAPGTEALGHLRGLQDQPDRLAAQRDGLLLCAALERVGFSLHAHASVADVVVALQARPEELRLDHAIGTADDAPLQLLAQALLHAHAHALELVHAQAHAQAQAQAQVQAEAQAEAPADPLAPAPNAPADPSDGLRKAAFVAWKKGSFVESGPGTDFNRAIERLHKFSTYVDRADHGPRTLANLGRDTREFFSRMLGIGKSPLTPMRHGALGADLGLLHEEAAKFKQVLGHALDAALAHLTDELADPEVQANPTEQNNRLARAAVFSLWRETDRSKFTETEVTQRAQQLLTETGGAQQGIDEPMLLKQVHRFTHRSLTGTGALAVRVGLTALGSVGAALAPPIHGPAGEAPAEAADPQALRAEIEELRNMPERTAAQQERLAELQRQRRAQIAPLVAQLRATKAGGAGGVPLFKLSDFGLLFGGAPRAGPTAADAQRLAKSLASARYESITSFADGSSIGAGTFGAFPLSIGAALGVPLVYPVLRGEVGKRAVVTVGVSGTGGRLFVGTERSQSGAVGVGAGWVAPTPAQVLTAVLLGDLSASHNRSHGEGVVITTRNDLPGWHDKLPLVTEFLFDEARLPPGEGAAARAATASESWLRFADRFGDDPHVAIGWNNDQSSGTRVGLSFTGVARIPVGSNTRLGPAVAVGLRREAGQFQRTPGGDGGDVPAAVRNRRFVASVSGNVAPSPTGVATRFSAVPAWGYAVPLVGAAREWNIAGGLGVARLGRTREGQLSPSLCQRELIFQTPEALIAFVNLRRDGWEAAMVAQDPNQTTTAATAHTRLDAHLEQVAATPRGGDRLHGASMSLVPRVAEQINHFEARHTTVLGAGDAQASTRELSEAERAECNLIENEVERLLMSDASWQHSALFSVELNQVGSSSGLDFGVKVVNQEQASATRLTALLIASLPEV